MRQTILIHTLFYQNYNYGGILQAYALYRKLKLMGFECEELNYSHVFSKKWKKFLEKGYYVLHVLRAPRAYWKKRKLRKSLYEQYKQLAGDDVLKRIFDKFIKQEFNATDVYYKDTIKKIQKEYDFYIVGGDQVWNPMWTDKNYFFHFVKNGKKIGFSCSAGKNKISIKDMKKYVVDIIKMDTISVRERNFSRVLRELGIENEIIADPVYLLSKEEWECFSNDRYQLPERYIFAYLLGDDEQSRHEIKLFSLKNRMPIVSIPHIHRCYNKNDIGFADVGIYDAGPREFVSLVKNATFVITDSFHGSAFSLILEKPFLSFNRLTQEDKDSLSVRLTDIMEEYGIKKRMVYVQTLEETNIDDMGDLDYLQLRGITAEKKRRAEKFLEEQLRNRQV